MIKNILSVLYKLFFRPNNEYLSAKQIQNYMIAEAILKKEFLEYEIVLDDYGDEKMTEPSFTIFFDVEKNLVLHKDIDKLLEIVSNDMFDTFETLNPFVYFQNGKFGINFDYGDEEEVKREIINMGYFLKDGK